MYKLTNRFYTVTVCLLVFFSGSNNVTAQDTALNKYGLRLINDIASYKKSVLNKPELVLADIKKWVPDIVIDLKYSGTNNFTQQQIYPASSTTYLRKIAALALAAVQKELNAKGLGLKIFDAYRPYAATELMWELVKDERYAADPERSAHNRGVAVDCTIINLKTMKESDMGTGFNFTDTAHHAFKNLPAAVLQNRLLLKTVMEKYGFKALETEWWHYALPDLKEYPLLNLSFSTLEK